MNQNIKQLQQYLQELNYYDPANFVTKSHKFNIGTTPIMSKSGVKLPNQQNQLDLQNLFSMQKTQQYKQVKQFIQSQKQTVPLLIKGPKHSGKKTLICQLIQDYKKQQKQKNKIFLPNFSSVNKVYSEILYNIMVKIRIYFSIDQKVQVNEQKIRRYFKYWLDITSDKIQKKNLGYQKSQKETLIIIIDGIDDLVNQRGEKVFPQFWLPQQIPKNIKLILSGTSHQIVIQKLQESNKVKVLPLHPRVISDKIKKIFKPQIQSVLSKRNLSLFQLTLLNNFLCLDKSFTFQPEDSFHQILEKYINKASSQNLTLNQIKSLLICLSLSKKGLTEIQLQKIIKMKPMSIDQFLKKFSPFICSYQDYYIILNSQIKKFIEQKFDPKRQKKQIYHQAIAKVLKRDQNSIRKLQEQIHHLSQAGKNFQIKQVIAQIQSFLILYTPTCKYLLCTEWKKMQITLNSDPVFQYNKAVQSFLAHYHPKQEQLYKIIYQLSMFFREYSDFQGAKIPVFRHPLIKGQQQQLSQISVYEQLKQLKMASTKISDKKLKLKNKKQKKDKQGQSMTKIKSKSKQKAVIKAIKSPRQPRKSINSEIQISNINDNINDSQKNLSYSQQSESNLNQVQKFNLQIKSNRDKFRLHYLSILQSYLKQYYIPVKKLNMNENFIKQANRVGQLNQFQQDDEYQQNFIQFSDIIPTYNFQKIKSNIILKNLDQYFQENYHREQNTKYYYYKEWIWIQFPWICQSLNSNFSEMIQQFITKPTQYMSVNKQFKFIKDVLKISQVSKQSKIAIYQSKPIQVHSIDLKKSRHTPKNNNNLQIQKPQSALVKISSKNQSMLKKRKIITNKLRDTTQNQQKDQNKGLNVAKYSLDISTIDQKLNTQINKDMKNRLIFDSRLVSKMNSRVNINAMYDYYSNNSSPYLTEANYNNDTNNNNKLPYLNNSDYKQSRIIRNKKDLTLSQSVMKSFQSYDTRTKRQQNQLNILISQNLKLKKQIQQMQKTSLMLSSIDTVSPFQQCQKNLKQSQHIKQKMLKKQQIQSKLRSKLQTIIKICDNNQSHQKQSQGLSNWLENLKIMTKYQKQNMERSMKQFENYLQNYKQEIKEIKDKKEKLEMELKYYQNQDFQQEQYQGNLSMNHHQNNNIRNSNSSSNNTTNSQNLFSLSQTQKDNHYLNKKHSSIKNKQITNQNANNSNIQSASKRNKQSIHMKKSKHNKCINTIIGKTQKIYSSQNYNQLEKLFEFFDGGIQQKNEVINKNKKSYQEDQEQKAYNYQQFKQNSQNLLIQFEQKIQKRAQLQMNYQDIKYQNQELQQKISQLHKQLRNNNDKLLNNRETTSELYEKRKILKELKNRIKVVDQCKRKYILGERI